MRAIASTELSGLGAWDRIGQQDADLCLTCRSDDGTRLMAIHQYPDSTIELFISSTFSPEQHVKVNGVLRSLHLDPTTMGDGCDAGLSRKLKPPLFDTSDRIIHWCRGVDRLEVERTVVADGVHMLKLVEAGETHLCYLVANESGHFCYHVADARGGCVPGRVSFVHSVAWYDLSCSQGVRWRGGGQTVDLFWRRAGVMRCVRYSRARESCHR